MGCACGNKKNAVQQTYLVTSPNGSTKTYSTEIEAVAASKRVGGTWRVQ
jgi:hypothetical protein